MTSKPASMAEMVSDGFLEMQESYANNWRMESTEWMRMGMYAKIASLVRLQEDGTHLDIGYGWGHLLSELYDHRKTNNISQELMGIESNEILAEGAFIALSQANIPANLIMRRSLQVENTEGKWFIKRNYSVEPDDIRTWNTQRKAGEIILVADDVRNATVVRTLMDECPVTSGTLTFPGVPGSVCVLSPHALESYDEKEEERRIVQASQEFRSASYALMGSLMQKGGQFITVERAVKNDNLSTDEQRMRYTHNLKNIMRQEADYWNVNRVEITTNRDLDIQSPLDWTSGGKRVEQHRKQGNGASIYIAELIRNGKKHVT